MRNIETIPIPDVETFLQEMVPQLGFQRNPFYRGQADADWRILPTLFRQELAATEFESWAELEAALLLGLKQRSRGEINYEPVSELEWMSTGEHYGLPTRLSSWSENALVALYFATAGTAEEKDGIVWRILPGETDWVITQDYEQAASSARLFLPQQRTHAMANQKTCYISHPLPEENAEPPTFEDLFELGESRMHLARLVIPAGEKAFFRRRLATMGIDKRALFPGMAGLCGQIRDEIYSHTDSYEWVFPNG